MSQRINNIVSYVNYLLQESTGEVVMTNPDNPKEVFKDESDKQKLPKYLRVTREPGKPEWNPLYHFLEGIFGELYKKVADGFMFMQSFVVFGKLELYAYKNGITRKSILVDEHGNPYEVNWEDVWVTSATSHSGQTTIFVPVSVEKMTNTQGFDILFKDYAKYLGVNKDNPYTTSYSEHKAMRDTVLKKMGYDVNTVKGPDDFGKVAGGADGK